MDPSCVYWTVHHLDSWIKIDQRDITCLIISLFTDQRVSNVSTPIFGSLRLSVDLFHVLCCSGSMCVGVTVWFGWGGVVSLCRLKHWSIEPEQYNPWNKSTISRKLLKMDVLTFETCGAVNREIIKEVTSSFSVFIQLILRLAEINIYCFFFQFSSWNLRRCVSNSQGFVLVAITSQLDISHINSIYCFWYACLTTLHFKLFVYELFCLPLCF